MTDVLHCAAFEHRDGGRCVEEFVVEVRWPRWMAALPTTAREWWANRHALRLARTAPRVATVRHLPENGQLFVLGMNRWQYPLGDFAWWKLSLPAYKVTWPDTHTFVQVDRATTRLFCWHQSSRPVRSTADTIVVDVTGTPWEAGWRRKVFGRFTDTGFIPDSLGGVHNPTPAQLSEAAHCLDPLDLPRQAEAVPVSRTGATA